MGEVVSLHLLPKEVKNEMLPTTDMFLNERKCTALVDTGFIQILVSRFMYHSWRSKELNVLMAD